MKQMAHAAFALACLIVLPLAAAEAGWDPNAEEKARETIADFEAEDPSLQAFFREAYAYAVFPTVTKGAIGIGGAGGDGVVFARNGAAIGTATMRQFTIGLQLGGHTFRQIIFFEDRATLERFKSGEVELAAQASAVASTDGAAASADYDQGVAVFVKSIDGLMVEASVGGQQFRFRPK